LKIILRIKKLLSKKDKQKVLYLLLFSFLISIIEVVGVSAIMPFVSLASDFTLVETNKYFSVLYMFFAFSSTLNFVIFIGMVIIVFYLFRSVMNIFYFHILARFSEGQYAKLSAKIYGKNVYMKNILFAKQNTATLTKTIVNETGHLTQVITAGLFMVSEVFILFLLTGILLYMNWKATVIVFTILVLVSLLLLRKVTKIVKKEGIEREDNQNKLFQIISHSFGNFKIIKLFAVEKEMLVSFASITRKYVNTNVIFLTYSHVPRLILDALGFSILILLVLVLLYTENGDIHTFIPMLTLYIVALYRMLPSLNRIIANYNKMVFYTRALDTIENELNIEKEFLGEEKLSFQDEIVFEKVNFSYDNKYILRNCSVSFKKGEKTAFIGDSGSGKSTLLDLIMGLNSPSDGKILVDSQELNTKNFKNWREKIGYIPQEIYLFDGTVAANVVFGREYDEKQIVRVLKKVHIYDFLRTKEGLNTEVGEGGKRLSGGQKQRIAIARALYGNPDILVLDEATSALDKKVESEIMQEIYQLSESMTLFLITHNTAITYGCNNVYRVHNGTLEKEEVL